MIEDGRDAVLELMRAIDGHIPQPERPKDKPFLMPIEDVFDFWSWNCCDGSC